MGNHEHYLDGDPYNSYYTIAKKKGSSPSLSSTPFGWVSLSLSACLNLCQAESTCKMFYHSSNACLGYNKWSNEVT